ncbi:MAG TPA: TOPRIM nucleotidyl transferase/hydrolase domain-containing protein [Solirubrobacteraceae bacterium]|nr:TOPRIM nucleotidyl transferase/hydrolase domain-containing protein [Solirubrobacteraceae bacterium]
MTRPQFGVRDVRIEGFRSARSVRFAPGPVCALVGGPSVGKSNILAAIWILLQRGVPALERTDVSRDAADAIELTATLGDGDEIALDASPPQRAGDSGEPVPVLFLPASLRSGSLLARPIRAPVAAEAAERYLAGTDGASSASPAMAMVAAVERLCDAGQRGLVLLIEEPELFLRPQAQRYLYRRLRAFAAGGNQVLYSTHEPAFLNVGRLDELALVEHSPHAGTSVFQPRPLPADESFRAVSELDAERGELLLARAALLVEGRTEKLTLPFVFQALGYDVDREQITIVDCGGKPNIPLFLRICAAARVPCVTIHDRDAPPGRHPKRSEQALNEEIAARAGRHRTVVLARDFEAVAGLRGHRHKPTRAWQLFSRIAPEDVPAPLTQAVEKVLALARS